MPSAMNLSCGLGDVIKSPRFVEGQKGLSGEILVGKKGNADDDSRATALFVVIGAMGRPERDCDVIAQRLRVDGSFDPEGEIIGFFQRKLRRGALIRPQEIELLGRMRQMFVWEGELPPNVAILDQESD